MDFADLTLEAVAAALADQAAAVASTPVSWAEKAAAGFQDYLTGLGETMKRHPEVRQAIMSGGIGAGIGAGVGGLGTAWGNKDRDPEERRSVLGSMLTGGLAGGAIGAGGSALASGIKGWNAPKDPRIEAMQGIKKQQEGPGPIDATIRGVAGNVGNFVSNAIPGLNPALKATGLAYGSGDKEPTWLDRNFPVSSNVLPKAGLLDFLAHTIPNAGRRFGIGQIDPERAKGYFNKGVGQVDKPFQDQHGISKTVLDAIRGGTTNNGRDGQFVADIPHAPGAGDSRSVGQVLEGSLPAPGKTPTDRFTNQVWGGAPKPGAGFWGRLFGGRDPRLDRPVMTVAENLHAGGPEHAVGPAGPHGPEFGPEATLTARQHGAINRLGYESENAGQGLRNIFGMQYRAPSKMMRIGGRLGAYGALPLAEYIINNQLSDAAKQTKVQRIVHGMEQARQGGQGR